MRRLREWLRGWWRRHIVDDAINLWGPDWDDDQDRRYRR